MTASLETAKADLSKYVERFARCVRHALEQFVADYGKLRFRHTSRTNSSIIHDLMVDQFIQEFGELERGTVGTGVHKRGQRVELVVEGGRYKLRLKKLTDKLLTMSIPTQAALRFKWQEQQLCFEAVEDPTNVFVGYQVGNEAALTESRVFITCHDGEENAWSWDLTPVLDSVAPTPTQILPFEQSAPAESAPRRVRLKDDAKPQESGDPRQVSGGGEGGAAD